MSCSSQNCRDLLGSYFLGACNGKDSSMVAKHLEECQQCRQTLDDWDPLHEFLLTSVEQMEAPPQLKRRIMDQVRSEHSASARENFLSRAKAYLASFSPNPRITLGLLPLGATAIVVLLFLLMVNPLGRKVANLPTTTAHGTQVAPSAFVSLRMEGSSATLRFSHLPSAGKDRRYEVWLQLGKSAPAPTKILFRPNSRGAARVSIPRGVNTRSTVLITSEPWNGSLHPTHPVAIEVRV